MTENTEANNIPLPTDLQPKPQQIEGNPLSQYFRHTKVMVELPTGGKFWPEGSLELNEADQLEVKPMTARDEILMKNPEGLLSGVSLAETVASCIPGIKDPWAMPAHDIDTVLISIRLASYDHELEIRTVCPHCKATNEDTVDLRSVLDSIPKGQIKNVFTIDELVFEFVPYTFRFTNENNKAKFEQEKLAQTLSSAEITDDEKQKYFNGMFHKLADHNTEALVTAINRINLPDGNSVNNKNQIKEFVVNASREMIGAIRDKLTEMNQSASIQPVTLTCTNCEKTYNQQIEFNQSNFFE
jgi:hypothetical protein